MVDLLIKKTDINDTDTVLEIGTGTGNITKCLCKVSKKVISMEKDRKLYQIAVKKLAGQKNLELLNIDFFNYNLPLSNYKCFSNIPFCRTADIMRKLLFSKKYPESAYLVMQKEAARRFIGHEMSTQISLLLAPLYSSRIIYNFRRSDFQPAPSVDNVLLEFKKIGSISISSSEYLEYRDFITFCFNKTHKYVGKTLLEIFSQKQLQILAKTLDFDLQIKPSGLKYKQWEGLFEFIRDHKDQIKRSIYKGSYKFHRMKHRYQKARWRDRIV